MSRTMLRDMDTTPPSAAGAPHLETDAGRQRRIAWEAEMIAQADAELDAGLYVDAGEIDAWIRSIGTDHVLPPPPTRRR
jgi:hypothetical protein